MSASEISVIIPIRNRAGIRLENCLRSLRWQDTDASVEIVLSDFGSDEPSARSIRELGERYDAKVEVTATDEVWNRSKALNLGIQAAAHPFVFCTDADMIFAPNFLSSLLNVHSDSTRDAMIHCRCHDLPERVAEQLWTKPDFESLLAAATVRPTRGTGACQSARRSFFFRARGYDEKFTFWGAEDIDMTARAQKAGLETVWVSEQTQMLHQWHPSQERVRWGNYKRNRWRFRLTRWMVVKNADGWGKLP